MTWGTVILGMLAALVLALGGWHVGHRQGIEEAWRALERRDDRQERAAERSCPVLVAEPTYDACESLLDGWYDVPATERTR